MMVKIQYVVLIAVICLIIGGALTKYEFPTVQTKTVVQTVTQTQVVDHVVTQTKEVKEPNGVVETDTTTTSDINKNITANSTNTDTIAEVKPDWHISGGVGFQLSNSLAQTYNIQVERRIIGPIFIGVNATTDHATAGVVVGLEF